MFFALWAACAASLLPALVSGQYQLVREYHGDSFFDGWNFYNHFDNLTNGQVNWVSQGDASSQHLSFINDAGNAVMKVDNSSILKFGQKRNSVRMSTKEQYTIGSLWVVDIRHVPYGCSVWGAFWSSASIWPLGGEIDTFEAVNNDAMSHMGLHTNAGCSHAPDAVQSSKLINSTSCDINANSNQGCIVTNPTTASYGAEFGNTGGGVYVTQFDVDGISIWYFNRSTIPDSIQKNSSSIDTTQFGIPVANWPASSCQINEFFQPQQLIFDITLCGDYAGQANVFYPSCSGVCYDDWVLGDPSHYDTAYFEVSYLRVYGVPGVLTVLRPANSARRVLLSASSVFISILSAWTLWSWLL